MRMSPPLLILILAIAVPLAAGADSLTQIVQKDLVTLGYDPGNTTGEANTATIVAISKFQAEHDLEVTGEATPQLAGILKAEIKKQGKAGATAAAPRSAPVAQAPAPKPAATQPASASGGMTAAQALCIQQKMQAKQEAEKKKRGFGRLLNAVSRTASRFGGGGLARDISQTTSDIYGANATAEDIKGAAEDLGLTEDDLEECRYAQ